MATINITDLKPVGSDLFFDSESYMNDLTADELGSITGGLPGTTITWTAASSGACVFSITVASLTWVGYQVYQHYNIP